MAKRPDKSKIGTILSGLLKEIEPDFPACSSCGFIRALNWLTPEKVAFKQSEIEASILKQRLKKHEHRITPDIVHALVSHAVTQGNLESQPVEQHGFGTFVRKSLECFGITKELMHKLGINCGCEEREKRWNKNIPFPRMSSKKKNCTGCSKSKKLTAVKVPEVREQEKPSGTLQFVWCYWHRGAKQDELRFSMRSVEKHYHGQATFLVIGDRPPWYDGPLIEQERIPRNKSKGFRRGLRDVLAKMETLSRHPDVDDDFVWMMDDVFMVQDTTREQLKVARGFRKIGSSRINGWQSVKTDTGNRLREMGKSAIDCATHLPHYVEKKKLAELFQVFNPLEETFLWEVAYQNFHGHVFEKHDPFLRRVKTVQDDQWYDRISKRSHFLNIYSGGWGANLRNWLLDRFPERHLNEHGDVWRYESLDEPIPLERHYLLVQSAYNEEEFSRDRLALTKTWLIPSLQGQTTKVVVQVSVCEEDPLLAERKEAFLSSGHEVEFVYRDPSNVPLHLDNVRNRDPWGIPVGPRVAISRIDDDDAIPNDFFELTQLTANNCRWSEALLHWPKGYVLMDGVLYRSNRPGNQFCTMLSSSGLHPHRDLHWKLPNTFPVVTVNPSRGWVWVRHKLALTETREIHLGKKASPPNMTRWSIDFTKQRQPCLAPVNT